MILDDLLNIGFEIYLKNEDVGDYCLSGEFYHFINQRVKVFIFLNIKTNYVIISEGKELRLIGETYRFLGFIYNWNDFSRLFFKQLLYRKTL